MRHPLTYPYLRQSLDKDRQRNSTSVQLEAARGYHAAFASRLPPWGADRERRYEETATSGAIDFPDRKAGRLLLAEAIPGDCVVFYHLDRLGRDMFAQIAAIHFMQKRGLKIHILDAYGQMLDMESVAGKIVLAVLSGMAESERIRTGQRTRDAIAYLRPIRGGCPVGIAPPGKCRDENGVMVEHPEERRQIEQALSLSIRGWSHKDIHAEFTRRGYRNRDGKPWSLSRIGRAVGAERRAMKDMRQRMAWTP